MSTAGTSLYYLVNNMLSGVSVLAPAVTIVLWLVVGGLVY